jgi:hypothetical protein
MTCVALGLAGALAGAPPAAGATPDSGTLAPNPPGSHTGSIAWHGTVNSPPGTTTGGSTDDCFGADGKPDTTSGCDFFKLDVSVPSGFYNGYIGGVQVDAGNFGQSDLDLGVYLRNPDGTHGTRVASSGQAAGEPEKALVPTAAGSYYVVLVPFTAPPAQGYDGRASFVLKLANPTLDQLNANPALRGPANYRASHDGYVSHSEPFMSMDPRNHDHLIAGSKMYEPGGGLEKYLFKIGTYESFDGGRTWTDYGQLPGYCTNADSGAPFAPACDVNSDDYRVVSDISTDFDDEGNAYANVIDVPGGASSGAGWNLNLHIKRPGRPWSNAITIQNNRANPVLKALFLDDKNMFAVDNHTTVTGAPNRPGDGQIGTMYVCWSFDFAAAGQQIAVMRSTDGGRTWGGHVPGDNTPYQVSHRAVISGIGCHLAIGPKGEVYATWYDNVLDVLWQAKSTDRGRTFSPERPIASITGVNAPFEGQAFRNLSIPTTAVDHLGTVYVAVTSADAQGSPLAESDGMRKPNADEPAQREADGSTTTGADIVLFKSTDGGASYTGPVRVNQDTGKADQFQPWMAVTPAGQVDISYFDRRNDPNNFYIQTWLSRSNDGGRTFRDTPVGHLLWDPSVNPPISPSGQFIGDYQGIVADDRVAIPFWNDTQANSLSGTEHSPWQEVWAARIGDTPALGGPSVPACASDRLGPQTTITRTRRIRVRVRDRGRRRAPAFTGRYVTRTVPAYSVTRRRISVAGISRDRDCRLPLTAALARNRGRVSRVEISLRRSVGRRCRFVLSDGRSSSVRSCAQPIFAFRARTRFDYARHLTRWSLSRRLVHLLASGRYVLVARGVDMSGNAERGGTRARTLTVRVR